MKEFKVNFTLKNGRITHRYFNAPTLSEAQAQFAAVTKHEVSNCVWTECPYIDVPYNSETGEILSEDALYAEYLEKYPNRSITFINFKG